MTSVNNIPFPNPHDADALNEFLDTRASGRDIDPEDDVQAAASDFHRLAASARFEKGPRDMSTATLSASTAPVSNRTRRQIQALQQHSRWNTWISTALVATLLLSLVGYGIWNDPGRDDNNLALAPQTASPITDDPLNPETSPWIADFSVEDCTLQGTQNYDLPSSATVEAEPQGYAVTGPASEEDALAVADAYRDMRGCRNLDGAFNYWSQARIESTPRLLNDENRQELTDLEGYFRTVYPDHFMAVATGLQVEPRLQDEWDLRNDHGITGLPIPLAAKLNPEWGVELSDGRVAFPATIVYAANDPAIVANGLPVDKPDSTVAMVFTFEDGAWKYDDSLLLCIVNCDYGVGNPVNPAEAPWARPADPEQCTAAPITSDEYRERLSDFPSYTDRSYNIAGNATEEDATEAARAGQSLLDCSLAGRAFVVEALLTDLGLHHYRFTQQATVPRSAELAGYLRQRDVGGRNLMLESSSVMRIAVVDGPITPYMPDGWTWEPLVNAENVASTHMPEYGFNPATAMLLGDGRIAFGATQLVALDSRAAITYEGNVWQWFSGWTVLQETEGRWRIDEMLFTHRDFMVVEANHAWWWEPQYDATPVATPLN